MSLLRYAKKRDAIEPAVIEALENRGYEVEQLDRPCDLIVRHPSWPGGLFQALEVKTPRGKKGALPAIDMRQMAQFNFCIRTGTPFVKSPMEAIAVLQEAGKPYRTVMEIA
jgi:hypothetical protein